MGLFDATALDATIRTAAFTERRHDVLAGNVANLDTPGYRSRDLDLGAFQATLAGSAGSPADATSPGTAGLRTADDTIVYHDGSDVSLERQVTRIAKNRHLQDFAITTMRSQFALLRSAITENA